MKGKKVKTLLKDMTENLSKLIDILCSRIAQPDVIKISFLLKLICLMSLQLKPHWGI